MNKLFSEPVGEARADDMEQNEGVSASNPGIMPPNSANADRNMRGMDDLELGAMLCFRLCHDLVSPIGALANGVEILEEESDREMQRQALVLLSHSAEEASRRLQFYRVAFGVAGGLGSTINLRDAQRTAESFFESGKTEVEWNSPDQSVDKTIVKLLLNVILTTSECLARGGKLFVIVEPQGEGPNSTVDISIRAEGRNAAISDETYDPPPIPRDGAPTVIKKRKTQGGRMIMSVAQFDTTLTKSDRLFSRVIEHYKAFPRAHPSAEFIT